MRHPIFLCLATPLCTLAQEPIAYTLCFPDAARHDVELAADLPTAENRAELELFMPVGTPGSYLVREYARNNHHAGGEQCRGGPTGHPENPQEPLDRGIPVGAASVHVSYRLFCREINVRGHWVERDFAMLNRAPTFVTVVGDFQRPYRVSVELPPEWATTETPLPSTSIPHTYAAPDFDTLVDSPILADSPKVNDFEVDGVRHVLVALGGGGVWDNARTARNPQHVVEVHRTFWGALLYDQPYYFSTSGPEPAEDSSTANPSP